MTSAKSYAVIRNESAWGVEDGFTEGYVPLTSFGLDGDVETREAKPACGVLHHKHASRVRRIIRGSLECPLYGTFGEPMTDWAFDDQDSLDRPSKTIFWIEPLGKTGWTGLRVDEATLSGDANGIKLQLNVVGKSEDVTTFTPTLPSDRGKMLEFLFSDVIFALDGMPIGIESFSWTARYGLSPKFNSGFVPSSCRATSLQQSLTIKPLKDGVTYAQYHRNQSLTTTDATLTMTCQIAGTTDRKQYVIDFNRLALMSAPSVYAPDSYIWQPITWGVQKPNSSTVAVQQTWSTV